MLRVGADRPLCTLWQTKIFEYKLNSGNFVCEVHQIVDRDCSLSAIKQYIMLNHYHNYNNLICRLSFVLQCKLFLHP